MSILKNMTVFLLLLSLSYSEIVDDRPETLNDDNPKSNVDLIERKHEIKQQDGVLKPLGNCKPLTPEVSFHVIYQGPHIYYGKHPVRIPYNLVRVNEGGGYSVGLHAFIAPAPGLYLFHVHGFSGPRIGCIRLKKNTDLVGIAEGHRPYGTMSLTSMMKLVRGDSVQVITHPGHIGSLYGGWTFNSFTGHLLR